MERKRNTSPGDVAGVLYVSVVILLSVLILFISLAKASLDIWASENNFEKARSCPVEFVVSEKDGQVEKGSHYLPGITILPGNPWYGLKEVRDVFWMKLSGDYENRAKTALIIADKRMSVSRKLFEEQKNKTAIIKTGEAFDFLVTAKAEWDRAKAKNPDLCNPVENQIFFAGLAYEEILAKIDSSFIEDLDKYNDMLNKIKAWNEKQKEEKFE